MRLTVKLWTSSVGLRITPHTRVSMIQEWTGVHGERWEKLLTVVCKEFEKHPNLTGTSYTTPFQFELKKRIKASLAQAGVANIKQDAIDYVVMQRWYNINKKVTHARYEQEWRSSFQRELGDVEYKAQKKFLMKITRTALEDHLNLHKSEILAKAPPEKSSKIIAQVNQDLAAAGLPKATTEFIRFNATKAQWSLRKILLEKGLLESKSDASKTPGTAKKLRSSSSSKPESTKR
ncbi:hypothetical protein CC86DRAFT_463785 [Ophiobolus disseminans]|uniref:Uncharacterized protein n=1 Tax=Ophiobolus disseminans TaxID=1469910 RepID=A0A6A7AC99_9PLEO|nr:hypothetical protein CC86DRAFT_463785 [Ophiobolus disseminans]